MVSNCNPTCTPGTCAAVVWHFCQLYLKIAEWLRGYSLHPPMTQQSPSLLIFWTFILTHSFAICYFCTSFQCTHLPSVIFKPTIHPDNPSHHTMWRTSSCGVLSCFLVLRNTCLDYKGRSKVWKYDEKWIMRHYFNLRLRDLPLRNRMYIA